MIPRRAEAIALPADVSVLSLDTQSRHLSNAGALEALRQGLGWLEAHACQGVYLKVDSTLRGHLGLSAACLRQAVGAQLAVVAPAFPQAGRLTVGGYQLVDGQPVSLTAYGADPLSPVSESWLPAVLAAGGEPVALVELRTVWRGAEAIARALGQAHRDGARLVAVDAARPEDLAALAWAIQHVPFLVLPVGSAGLAQALATLTPGARVLGAMPPRGSQLLGRGKPVLVVSGSINPISLEQLARLGASVRVVRLDVRQLLLTGDDELERLHRQAVQGVLAGTDVVLATATTREQVLADQQLAAALGMTSFQLGQHLSQVLGRLVPRLVESGEVANLVLVGGETASAVSQHLGAEGMEIETEVVPAIPALRTASGALRLVTKSGGFGSPESLLTILDHLRQASWRSPGAASP